MDEVKDFLKKVQGMGNEAKAKVQNNGFVFDGLGGPWQKLAFTFYTDIWEMSFAAENLLEAMNGEERHEEEDSSGEVGQGKAA